MLHALLRPAAFKLAAIAGALALLAGCAGSSRASSCGCRETAPPAVQAAASDEAALMARVRSSVKSAPTAALADADEAERRFGESSWAEERRALAISALINMGQIGAARSRAYPFLQRYPNGPYSSNVAAMTGVHVTP